MQQLIYYLEKEKLFSASHNVLAEPKQNEVMLEFLFCGICGGDYSHFLGLRNIFPVSLGHEFIARVIKTGNNVIGVQKGDLVVSDLNYRCNACIFCKRNQTHLCIDNNIEMFTNRGFASHALIDSEYLVVANDLKQVLHGTLVEPLSCVIHAINQISLKNDDNILICGVGNIGTITAFYLTHVLKLKNVYVYDCIIEKQKRVENLFGCKPHEDDCVYDIVIEATNSLSGMMFAMIYARYARKICSISHLYGVNLSEVYEYISKNEINILFPLRNGNKPTLQIATKVISDLWEEQYDCIFEMKPIKEINELFNEKCASIYNKQIVSINDE